MRGPGTAAADDRRTAWRLVKLMIPQPTVDEDEVSIWLEEGKPPSGHSPAHDFAMKIAAELEAERKRVTVEVAFVIGRNDGLGKGDHVRVTDPNSRHHGKSALVWFVRDGRVMVNIAKPRSTDGAVSASFLPEHLEKLEAQALVSLERAVLLRFMRENAEMNDNLTSTQERCTALLLATRSMRQKIAGLGGEDPGPP